MRADWRLSADVSSPKFFLRATPIAWPRLTVVTPAAGPTASSATAAGSSSEGGGSWAPALVRRRLSAPADTATRQIPTGATDYALPPGGVKSPCERDNLVLLLIQKEVQRHEHLPALQRRPSPPVPGLAGGRGEAAHRRPGAGAPERHAFPPPRAARIADRGRGLGRPRRLRQRAGGDHRHQPSLRAHDVQGDQDD